MLHSLPLAQWLKTYNRADLAKDCTAGLIVTIVLVPQSMAYALLAGVPAEYGLYCAILPTLLYSLFASSRYLAVGPAALISIMVANAVGQLQPESNELYLYYATQLAFLTGLILLVMRLLRLGNLTRFISIPVISGFTSASAIVIATSQLQYIMGISLPKGLGFIDTSVLLLARFGETNLSSLGISVICLLALWLFKTPWKNIVSRLKIPYWIKQIILKSGPLITVLLAALCVSSLQLDTQQNVAVVGTIPGSLPGLYWISIDIDLWKQLVLPAFFIALMCFVTSIAVSSQMARKDREKVNPDQELFALGAANIGAAFCGTFSLAGSLSRSAVNHDSGAKTSIASMIAALGVLATLLSFTSLFYFMPLASLAAVVIMSVFSMIQIKQVFQYWRVNRNDGLSLVITFLTVLIMGIEIGIIVGIVYSIILLIKNASHPHIAEVGRVGNSEHFRNINRHKVITDQRVIILRVDESLYFANADYVESYILQVCDNKESPKHLVLICSSISFIDASATEMLASLIEQLNRRNICLHLTEVKGPVMDQIEKTDLLERLKPGKIFLTTNQAFCSLCAGENEG